MELIRGIGAAMLARLSGRLFHPVVLVELDWPGGMQRLHTGVGIIDWDDAAWDGVGQLGSVSVPEESPSLVPSSALLGLTGLPPEIYDRLDDPIRNRPGRILVGCLTGRSSNLLAGDPVEIFAGYMDALRLSVEVEDDAGETRIVHALQLELGSGPGARSVASITHSAEDQAAAFPGDTAGRHCIYNRASMEVMTWPES
ncbi:hypothetical protein [Oceanicella sp. SM1341]|uniref:hypothetical protein n=1 Tax=Oceanicella sp. SM1341 TaxID=1548889 RepID=UPI000E4F861C|nr:hypothetical protein [Oceanicella sp. SM1341]